MDRVCKNIDKNISEEYTFDPIKEECSSEDSTYDSIQDNNEYYPNESDEEYVPKTFSKRSTKQDGGKYRKISISSSISDDVKRNVKMERMPTRRPNPKVFNRNALLARENRRRKKELMEKLEEESSELKSENQKLKKMLKLRNGTIEKLSQEKQYLKSVIANRTEILSILKSVQTTKIPITSSALSYVTDESTSSRYNSPQSTADDNDFELSDIASSDDLNHYLGNYNLNNNFGDDVPNVDEFVTAMSASTREVINSEHNYFELDNKQKLLEPGVCLHISSGKISLEFCSTCHLNSQNAWLEEN